MSDDPSLYGQDEYFERIERQFGLRRRGPLMLSPRDWQRVESWQKEEIPLEVVLRGINRAFDHFEATADKTRRINSLSYCEQHIRDAWHQACERADGGGTADPGDPTVTHLLECAAACRRHVGEHVGAALETAATALEQLAREAGSLSAAELDARATEIQDRLAKNLGAGQRSVPLPPFSPWAV